MKYTILTDTNTKNLIEEVNKYIQAGWKPLGGLAAAPNEPRIYHYQAMIKGE